MQGPARCWRRGALRARRTHRQAGGPASAWPLLLFSTRRSPSCRRLAARRSPGAEDVWVSTLLPSSSSSTYRQACATEEARPRFNILVNTEESQAGESPPRGRGTASHLSHVPAPGVTRSQLGFPPGSPGGCSGPSRGDRPACPRRLPRAPRAVRPRRPRLCARFRGTALLTQKEAEPRRPASRRSREPEVSENVPGCVWLSRAPRGLPGLVVLGSLSRRDPRTQNHRGPVGPLN